MLGLEDKRLKLAVQKEGRLTKETLAFLWKSGLDFEATIPKLYSSCRNFPLEILYLRDNDIPKYVEEESIDLGIVGQNLLYEKKTKVKKLLNLKFGYCSLILAVPRESNIKTIKDLENLKVATSYPNSTKRYFSKNKIKVEIVVITGSSEIAPTIGVASAIVDLTSTGSTLLLNDLRIIDKIYVSEAVLIANKNIFVKKDKLPQVAKLILRFKAVLSAKDYKYVVINAPSNILPKLRKLIPGIKNSFFQSGEQKVVSLKSVIKEDYLWEILEKIKKMGVVDITVLPIEKLIN